MPAISQAIGKSLRTMTEASCRLLTDITIERRALEGISVLARRDGQGIGKEVIIGAAVGGCVVALLMIFATFFIPEYILRRRERKKAAEEAAVAAKVQGGSTA